MATRSYGGTGLVLLVALTSSVLVCLMTLWIMNPTGREPVVVQPRGDDELFVRLLEQLSRRVDEGFRAALRPQAGVQLDREAISEVVPFAEQMEEVRAILDRLEGLAAILKSSLLPSENLAPLNRSVPVDWVALDALRQLHKTDPPAALQSIMLLTVHEVIEQFGFPTKSSSNAGALFFKYGNAGDGTIGEAIIKFTGGLVIDYFPPR